MIMALYLRLSKEDGDLVDESNSITNQRYILRKYAGEMPEAESLQVREYIDDGYSGKNFERPGIKRLLEDVRSGEIYGIIVKDFSRFGRNHIEVGNYIEKIFPLLNVRFIAVNNHFDSKDFLRTTPDMDVAFENLMYDYFSEENSIKIRNDLLHKRMRGKYMASFAVYGYRKAEDDHNQLVVDEEAADVVRLIFELYVQCGVKAEVARCLNQKKLPTPQEYAKQKGVSQHWKYEEGKKYWNASIIGRILRNPVYVGNTVFHKKEVVEVGSRRTKCLPESQWKICENTHEAIISQELFDQVGQMEREAKNKASQKGRRKDEDSGGNGSIENGKCYCGGEKRLKGSETSAIKGFVKCGGCKHNMNRRNRKNATYFCRHYYEVKAPGCCGENIREDDLMEMVKNAVIRQAALAAGIRELLALHDDVRKQQDRQREREKKQIRSKLQKCREESFSSYERYKNGEISGKEFQELRQKNLSLQEEFRLQLEQCEKDREDSPLEALKHLPLLEGKEELTVLSREVVEQLVSAIYVYGKNRVEIVFKFKDEMRNIFNVTNSNILP